MMGNDDQQWTRDFDPNQERPGTEAVTQPSPESVVDEEFDPYLTRSEATRVASETADSLVLRMLCGVVGLALAGLTAAMVILSLMKWAADLYTQSDWFAYLSVCVMAFVAWACYSNSLGGDKNNKKTQRIALLGGAMLMVMGIGVVVTLAHAVFVPVSVVVP